MINLFNIPNYTIDTANFSHHLHGDIVNQFENNFKEYVGAKYACSVNSATNAIFLSLKYHQIQVLLGREYYDMNVTIPSLLPPVVANAILLSEHTIQFKDEVDWVGSSYTLAEYRKFKIIDSAQRVDHNQFANEANDNDLMIFSFYPTKPVGSMDGGMIVSNDEEKIEWFKALVMNGTTFDKDSWSRKNVCPGWKMYMNSAQAYIANENLKKLDEKKESLAKVRAIYNKELRYTNNSDHLYRISVPDNKQFIDKMKQAGIICGIHYAPLHLDPVYSTDVYLPRSERAAGFTASIPFHEALSESDIEIIIKNVKKFK